MYPSEGQDEVADSAHGEEPTPPLGTEAGVFVFSESMQLLLVTRRALELTGQVSPADSPPFTFVLPNPVRELCAKVREAIGSRRAEQRLQPFKFGRTLCEFGRPAMLTGFGIPPSATGPHARILLVLQEDSRPSEQEASHQSQFPSFRDTAA